MYRYESSEPREVSGFNGWKDTSSGLWSIIERSLDLKLKRVLLMDVWGQGKLKQVLLMEVWVLRFYIHHIFFMLFYIDHTIITKHGFWQVFIEGMH